MKLNGYDGALLYVSDPGANVVDVLTFPGGKRIGKLTGFDRPRGECVDKAGNVYIANQGASNVLEYAHGGTTPIDTIDEPGQEPYGCSANLNRGNFTGYLAVLSSASTSDGRGSVTVYGGQEGGTYELNMFSSVASLSYTKQKNGVGELFIDGLNDGEFQIAVLGPHRHKFRPRTLPHGIASPGGIQWDGEYLAVGDQSGPSGTTSIEKFSIRNGRLTFIGTTALSQAVEQYSIADGTLIGPYSSGGSVGFWNYPAGGFPTKVLNFFVAPFGSAVSEAPKRRAIERAEESSGR